MDDRTAQRIEIHLATLVELAAIYIQFKTGKYDAIERAFAAQLQALRDVRS